MGTCPNQPSRTASADLPVRSCMDAERLPSRSVSVKPGRTLLMVMHGAYSLDMDLAHEAMAPRMVFERPMLGMGSLTEVEMIWTILP